MLHYCCRHSSYTSRRRYYDKGELSSAAEARAHIAAAGRGTKPIGLFIIVWTALAWYLSWWFTWETGLLRDQVVLLCALNFALMPALCLLWRGRMGAAELKKQPILIWALSAASWAAAFGYSAWALCGLSPAEQQAGSESLRYTFGWIYDIARWALLILALVTLLRAWWEGSGRRLPAAAWCMACLSSINYMLRCKSRWMMWDAVYLRRATLAGGLAVVVVVGLGSAVVTALLIRRGSSDGRSA